MKFSVVIPLYNKESEIGRALRSVLAQTLPPAEIVVVDDGSTDSSAAVVEQIIKELDCFASPARNDGIRAPSLREPLARSNPGSNPEIKLIRQSNAGETAARNRGMSAATGDCFALLDADDEWRPEFLATVAALASEYPNAGLWCTGFDIARGNSLTPGRTPSKRGVVEDFWAASTGRFVATASSSVLSRSVVAEVGGFPEGMRLGGDQYMWTKVALRRPVVFTPERLAVIHATASNRSAAIYVSENTTYSFLDFYDPAGDPALNEYIARIGLGKAISASVRGGTDEGRRGELDWAWNRRSRRLWWRLWLLNRLPRTLRPAVNGLYKRLAWLIARKGV